MRGHEALIAMRLRGVTPEAVFIDTDPDGLRCWESWPVYTPEHAHLQIDPADKPERLDLRCVVALAVFVSGSDAERVVAVARACHRHHPSRVIASAFSPDARYPDFFNLTAFFDSDGLEIEGVSCLEDAQEGTLTAQEAA